MIVPTFNPGLALSPDGTHLAYTPLPGPVVIRRLDTVDGQPLEASATPGFRQGPLFSPDGASLAYVDGNAPFSWRRPFQKVALAGGPALTLAEYDMFHRGDWSDDGWLYWTARYPGGIVRIRDSGGATEAVTTLDVAGGERSHRFASLLPGGDALIYTVGFEGIDNYDDARIDLWDMTNRNEEDDRRGRDVGHVLAVRAHRLRAGGKADGGALRRDAAGSHGNSVRGAGRRHDEPEHRGRPLHIVQARRPRLRAWPCGGRPEHAGVGRSVGEGRTAAPCRRRRISTRGFRQMAVRWPWRSKGPTTTFTSTISREPSSARSRPTGSVTIPSGPQTAPDWHSGHGRPAG